MSTNSTTVHPAAIIGAGPVGLAAAAHLLARGIEPLVFEAGARGRRERARVGPRARVLALGVQRRPGGRRAARATRAGPRRTATATRPAPSWSSATWSRWPRCRRSPRALHLGARVVGVARHGLDKLKDAGREDAPFELVVEQDGVERRVLARAVIDASGTWTQPNPLGAGGLPAVGERALRRADRLRHPRRARPRPRPLRRQARAGGRQRPLGVQRAPRPGRAARLRAARPRSCGRSAAARPGASTAAAATTSCPRAARSAPPCAAGRGRHASS